MNHSFICIECLFTKERQNFEVRWRPEPVRQQLSSCVKHVPKREHVKYLYIKQCRKNKDKGICLFLQSHTLLWVKIFSMFTFLYEFPTDPSFIAYYGLPTFLNFHSQWLWLFNANVADRFIKKVLVQIHCCNIFELGDEVYFVFRLVMSPSLQDQRIWIYTKWRDFK